MLVQPGVDQVTVDGQPVEASGRRHYLVLNKPAGVITTARDPERRPTVMELVPPDLGAARLFPVGRLDADTTGLLLLTDDGELAQRLAHPRHKVVKEYLALVSGAPGERDLRRLREGVDLEDGRTQPAQVELMAARSGLAQVRIVLAEGRNRQVRRMLESVGHPAKELHRTAFGPIHLGRLRLGGVRRLRPPEIESLRAAAGLAPSPQRDATSRPPKLAVPSPQRDATSRTPKLAVPSPHAGEVAPKAPEGADRPEGAVQ
jgi:23S rRNA pseudouridine2605 synthase